MNNYEKLRNIETSKELSDDFKREFEDALSKAIEYWQKHGMLVDRFEDNFAEASFAKGFFAGCIYMDKHHSFKPTKIQMELLKEACDTRWEVDGLDPLYQLYQNLNKLKYGHNNS